MKGKWWFQPWVSACDQMMQGGSQCIDVALGICSPSVLLGGRIALCPDHCAFLSGLEDPRNPKVDEHYVVGRTKHNVRRLHIAKDYGRILAVQI